MKLLLNSLSLVPLLIRICAEMNETSFESIRSCLAAGRDLCRDGGEFFSIRSGLFALLVGVCAKVDDNLFDFVLLDCCSEFAPRRMKLPLNLCKLVWLLVGAHIQLVG